MSAIKPVSVLLLAVALSVAVGHGSVGLLFAAEEQSPEPETRSPGSFNPRAPEQTGQFGFPLGTWSCKTRFLNPDGSGYSEGSASWAGYYILDGWAIQDDWIGHGSNGQEFHGTNIRSFNPRTKKWANRWLPAGSLQWTYFESQMVGETMVMIGGEGEDARGAFVDRNTFHDILTDRWSGRKDRSYDGGETWIEGIGFIEATRAQP